MERRSSISLSFFFFFWNLIKDIFRQNFKFLSPGQISASENTLIRNLFIFFFRFRICMFSQLNDYSVGTCISYAFSFRLIIADDSSKEKKKKTHTMGSFPPISETVGCQKLSKFTGNLTNEQPNQSFLWTRSISQCAFAFFSRVNEFFSFEIHCNKCQQPFYLKSKHEIIPFG